MAEYIERDAVEKMIEGAQLISGADGEYCGYCTEDISIYSIPAADVAPVVHGRWIRYPDCGVTRCSNCGWSIEECFDSKYCPNCGAKMDMEQE